MNRFTNTEKSEKEDLPQGIVRRYTRAFLDFEKGFWYKIFHEKPFALSFSMIISLYPLAQDSFPLFSSSWWIYCGLVVVLWGIVFPLVLFVLHLIDTGSFKEALQLMKKK